MKEAKETQNEQKKEAKTSVSLSKQQKFYIGLCGIIAALAGIYILIGLNYRNVFFPATSINGMDVSGLTPAQARDALNNDIASYILTISGDNDLTEQISGGDIGLCAIDDNTLQTILDNQNMFTWGIQGFREKEYTLDIGYSEENLRAALDALTCMDKKKWVSPENAYIRYSKGAGYEIVPAVPGNVILTDAFYEAAASAVDNLDSTLVLRDAGLYKLPEIPTDDAELQEQLARMQAYSEMTVTYQFDSQTEVLDSETICEWITLKKNGDVEIDEEAAAQFVKDLSKKYNTAYSPKTLETSYGTTVTISRGFYGWMIDRDAELQELMEILREGKSVTREPVYSLTAASHEGPDYGDTYVEINLTAQHLFYYKNGELLVESDFVSGNPSKGNATPDGAYAVTYTERNATLNGQGYSTPVSYWMPFNGNVGMHDSNWRSAFGGVIYQTNGSHGCINLPPAVAKKIFENIEKGIPVLCYHLGGTEQAPDVITPEQLAAEGNPAESTEPGVVPVDAAVPDVQIPPTEAPVTPDVQVPPAETPVTPDVQVPPAEAPVTPDAQVSPAEMPVTP